MGLTKSSVGRGASADSLHTGIKDDGSVIIALAGNPNVGKSSVFNALTGLKQHTGNWSGKTVTTACGKCAGKRCYTLVDLPGTYSLSARSPEEEVARDFICSGRAFATVVVCDATCLERNMNLVLQVLEVSERVIVCLNLIDEARRKGIKTDTEALSKRLGVPVVTTCAHKKKSLKNLIEALDSLNDEPQEHYTVKFPQRCESASKLQEEMSAQRVRAAEEICKEVKIGKKSGYSALDRRLDRIFTSRATGYPVMLLLLALILWLTIAGANYPSELLSAGFTYIGSRLSSLLEYLKAPDWLNDMLTEGVFKTLGWVISVMLPPMAIFFPLFTLLEDSGYLPRLAYNLDRPFKRCNACGKQALTMCMGLGCNAAGVIGCRIIDSPRERLLAVLTNSLVPCNGRFPTLIAIITVFFAAGSGGSVISALMLTCVIMLGVLATLGCTKLLSATLLKGIPSSFTLELPPYRRPQIGRVIVRSVFDRTLFVLGRSAAVAAPAGLIIWLAANIRIGGASILAYCCEFLDPAAKFMGLDGVLLMAFILGFPANETVLPIAAMGYLAGGSLCELGSIESMRELFLANGWTPVTAVCTLIFMLFHWPCSTTLITVKKETGSIKHTLTAALLPTLLGAALCIVINLASALFGF